MKQGYVARFVDVVCFLDLVDYLWLLLFPGQPDILSVDQGVNPEIECFTRQACDIIKRVEHDLR